MGDADSDQVKRLLVVFIDDLDRCTPASVLEMFEAIKVYMDVFGIVFVVAYDERVVADALQSSPALATTTRLPNGNTSRRSSSSSTGCQSPATPSRAHWWRRCRRV